MWIWTIIGHYHNTGDLFGSSRRDQTCALQTYMKTGPATGAVNEDSRNVTIIALLKAPPHILAHSHFLLKNL